MWCRTRIVVTSSVAGFHANPALPQYATVTLLGKYEAAFAYHVIFNYLVLHLLAIEHMI
jgi:hypothetical protein